MSHSTPTSLTSATWNIHGGRNRKGRPFHFVESIAHLGADVIGLQELELHRVESGGSEATDVLKDSEFEYSITRAFSDSPFSPAAELAVALLSSEPFSGTDAVVLPNPVRSMNINPTFHDKGLIVSEICWRNTTVDVITLHLYPFHRIGMDARDPRLRPLWAELDELLRPRPNVPRIILGDFNTPHRFELLKSLQLGELRSMFLNSASRDDGQSHDDILISAQWLPQQLRNIRTESDHNLLIADLILNPTGGK
jgi:endonuclease/exonuclease/phosphatase family metal-dependent hydrolase